MLVEDDPVSRSFLAAAAEAFPARVDIADSVASAFALATGNDHALWLIDAQLPDGSGAALLARLRLEGLSTPALAHTASQDPADLDALAQAGFVGVLVKPLSSSELQAGIGRALARSRIAERLTPLPSAAGLLWDDAAALASMNGNREHVASLRKLFLAELPAQSDSVLKALQRGDRVAASELLHRLKASCGFVGAVGLKSAVQSLDSELDDSTRIDAFALAVDQTLSASSSAPAL